MEDGNTIYILDKLSNFVDSNVNRKLCSSKGCICQWLMCKVNLQELSIYDRNAHKPLFRQQEVINFENNGASLQTDDCFAIKVSHFKLQFDCHGNYLHLSCNLWEPLLLQTISKVILYSSTIVFYSIVTVCEPTTEREVLRDVCKQTLRDN